MSAQLESFTNSAGFVNSTTPAFQSTTSRFMPSPAARWINTLWFLSLVFSLAAALFGILAKQWLREYMKWNDSLGTPRDNILVRQIRFEAWNEWNVPATISAIPALLELALIMFLAGLLVFLWTIDIVVAIVITVAVTIFLGLAIYFTIAPVFWRRCPYKSPTSWAIVILLRFFVRIGQRIVVHTHRSRTFISLGGSQFASWARSFVGHPRSPAAVPSPPAEDLPYPCTPELRSESFPSQSSKPTFGSVEKEEPPYTWRRRDIEGNRPGKLRDADGEMQDAAVVVELSLRSEAEEYPRDIPGDEIHSEVDDEPVERRMYEEDAVSPTAEGPTLNSEHDMDNQILDGIAALADDATLVRALSWASRASQNPHVKQHVALCTETLRGHLPIRNEGDLRTQMLSLWNIVLQNTCIAQPSVSPPKSLPGVIKETRRRLQDVYGIIQTSHSSPEGSQTLTILRRDPPQNPEIGVDNVNFREVWRTHSYDITVSILFNILQSLTSHLPEYEGQDHTSDVARPPHLLTRRFVELLCLAHALSPPDENPTTTPLVRRLLSTYNRIFHSDQRDELDAKYPGLRSSLLQFIRQFFQIKPEDHSKGSILAIDGMYIRSVISMRQF